MARESEMERNTRVFANAGDGRGGFRRRSGSLSALIFILDVALAVDSDDRQQVERWLEQLESLERLVDLDQDRPPPELTAWELDQAKHCRETVQRAINNSEWLADEGFSRFGIAHVEAGRGIPLPGVSQRRDKTATGGELFGGPASAWTCSHGRAKCGIVRRTARPIPGSRRK